MVTRRHLFEDLILLAFVTLLFTGFLWVTSNGDASPCTHGESSVTLVDGVQSGPERTGCQP